MQTSSSFKAVAAQQQQQAAAASRCGPRASSASRQQCRPAAPAPAAAPAPCRRQRAESSDATSTNTADWACIRQHESGDNYSEGTAARTSSSSGHGRSLTGLPSPAEDYPPAVQDAAALKLYAQRGWEPWTTRYVCGL